jgi:hypothetical protein
MYWILLPPLLRSDTMLLCAANVVATPPFASQDDVTKRGTKIHLIGSK